jgi:hypothetical protein
MFPVVGATPSDENVLFSTEVRFVMTDNEFADNKEDALGGVITVPEGLDTSTPITVQIPWYCTVTTCDVEMEWDVSVAPAGSVLDGSLAEVSGASVITVPTSAGEYSIAEFEVDVSALDVGDLVSFRVFRDATGGNGDDDCAGSVVVVRPVSVIGTFWR